MDGDDDEENALLIYTVTDTNAWSDTYGALAWSDTYGALAWSDTYGALAWSDRLVPRCV